MKILRFFLPIFFAISCNDIGGNEMITRTTRHSKKPQYTPNGIGGNKTIAPITIHPKKPQYKPSPFPPPLSKGFVEIYRQPEIPAGAAFGGEPSMNRPFYFPEPEDGDQKKYWEGGWKAYNGSIKGLIKALADGQVEISGLVYALADVNLYRWELGLWIGEEKDMGQNPPIKIFSVENSEDTGKDRLYKIYASAPIKAGEKILFKNIGSATYPRDLHIYFKPK